MSRDFIELYDDDGYRYIVNMDKISFINVAGRKVWGGEVATLTICDESMERLLSRLVGEGDADGLVLEVANDVGCVQRDRREL